MGSGPHKCSAGMTTAEGVIQGRYLCHSGAAKPSPEPMTTSVSRIHDGSVHGFRPSQVFGGESKVSTPTAAPPSSPHHDQEVLGVDLCAGRDQNLCHRAVAAGMQRRLHLHRLDGEENVAGLHRLARLDG